MSTHSEKQEGNISMIAEVIAFPFKHVVMNSESLFMFQTESCIHKKGCLKAVAGSFVAIFSSMTIFIINNLTIL